MAKALKKNFFQYARFPFIPFIKVRHLSMEIRSSNFSIKSLVSKPTVNIFDATFLIAILM